MSRIHELAKLGQSVWYDFIRRSLMTSGELQRLIEEGLLGMTSNPTIFEKAIAGSTDYDDDLRALVAAGKSVDEIYETLAFADIAQACDLLRPIYDRTGGADGFVSLEVNPNMANDSAGTAAEARRLRTALGRPNLMIKVPATSAGIPVITELIGAGINVNVTLIFDNDNYQKVAEAYLVGLEKLAAAGGDLRKVASVASFFVSRIDTAVDAALAAIGSAKALTLQGKIAIANAKMAYLISQNIFAGLRWEKLTKAGARVQRLLWASTGTKNPAYPDTLYVDTLIAPQTVNTVPPATYDAVRDHGKIAITLPENIDAARAQLASLQELGVDLRAITKQLQIDGVAAFAKSFVSLLASIAQKREKLLADEAGFSANLGRYQPAVDAAVAELREQRILARIWAKDHTVWKPEPTEISNRLGWLRSPAVMVDNIGQINALVKAVRAEGYTHALLLGMGGSSLAPEVFRRAFGVRDGYLDHAVLDSTDPGAVLGHAKRLDPRKTLFIVSTKSGGTVETFSFFKYFYNQVADAVGVEEAGKHFVAITDPKSGLVETAREYRFRTTFLNDPDIGGRYSALSFFGLVPAALIGIDLAKLLDRAATMACECECCDHPAAGDNPGARLGVILGELAMAGRDKLTLVMSPAIASFGAWAEQLVAESTGKEGIGILPVEGEPIAAPAVYADDRLFVYLRLAGDTTYDAQVQALVAAGHPVVQLHLNALYDLGGEFFRWEIATAIAGRRLEINPFDQPNVESAKVLARKMVAAYQATGKLPAATPTLETEGITIYASKPAKTLNAAMQSFLAAAAPGDHNGVGRSYLSIQAYVTPNAATDAALQNIRTLLRDRLKMATTVGYGPRFLHSTGQLHKGDAGHGLFIQLTSDPVEDAAIPDKAGADSSTISFGVLKLAQALGDRQALLDNHRRVIRLHLGKDVANGLQKIARALA